MWTSDGGEGFARSGGWSPPYNRALNPLIPDHPELPVVLFVEPLRAVLFGGDEAVEEFLGIIRDLLAGLAHRQSRGVEVVFLAGDAQRLLAGVLADEVGELLVEHPDVVVREGGRVAMALEGVLDVAEL